MIATATRRARTADQARAGRQERTTGLDHTALSDRMGYLTALRLALAVTVLMWVAIRPEMLDIGFESIAIGAGIYAITSIVGEVARRNASRFGFAILTTMLLLDGLALAAAMYATGGTQSPLRFLTYLHLVAVSLLASYRTGLKIALWHSLLLFVVLYAQAAQLVPAVEDIAPGRGIEFDQMPVLNVTSFWLFAIATSLFSALNERELRQRRSDLQAMVDVGARLDAEGDPLRQSRIVLDGLVERFGFRRGLVLGASGNDVIVLASRDAASLPEQPVAPDPLVARAWDRRSLVAVRRLDAGVDPIIAAAMPDARNVLVSPMIIDGEPVGAIVIEHPTRRLPGVDRRIASMLGQVASTAALNLRNAVLLEHVRDLAERDSLTGAANRRAFQSSLERVLGGRVETRPGDRVTAVLFIDLDDFKIVNDSLGHAAGDALLIAVTERISNLVRGSDLVARLGGDEFAILTDDDAMLSRSRAMAERLVRELRAPYLLGEHHVSVSASIGIASARDAAGDAADLVRNADVAMYMAKANGKSGFAIFDPGMHAAIRERHELGVELQRAAELSQLRLQYQPIIDLATGRLAAVEALVRWEHPDRGLIAPGQFIEIAEENGAILPIGRWVLGEACGELGRWLRTGLADPDLFACVNVSAREICQPGFVDGVVAALAESGVPATSLVLEITETALLRATPATMGTLEELRALGVRTVIDDFGTGYFSLSHLRQFPVDALKIAGEFVADVEAGSRSSKLAAAIIALGQSLAIDTVAEGIETAEQAERMQALGCTYGQGFYFAQPLAAADIAVRLRGERPASSDAFADAEASAEAEALIEATRTRAPRRRLADAAVGHASAADPTVA